MSKRNQVSPEVVDIIHHGAKDDIVSNVSNKKKLLTTKQVSQIYSVPEGTLNNWAYKRVGPRFYKVGRLRLYDPDHCENFFKANPILTIDQH